MVSVLRTLQAEWNALVPQAQALNIRRVRTLNDPLETIPYRRGKLEWLQGEIARLGATTSLTPTAVSPRLDIYTFGVELEFIIAPGLTRDDLARVISAAGVPCRSEGYNHNSNASNGYWKIVTDASVDSSYSSGFELVSPPLRGQEGFDQVGKVCSVLTSRGCKVNKKCGLHVHVGASDWQLDTFKNLVRLYASAERAIDSLMAPSRRESNNTYCKSLRVNHAYLSSATTMDSIAIALGQQAGRHNARGWGRYFKLNLQSFWQHGTVEFRQHQGTVEAAKTIYWVKMCLRMAAAAHTGSWDAPTLEDLFRVVQAAPDERAFFQGRVAFFASQVRREEQRAARPRGVRTGRLDPWNTIQEVTTVTQNDVDRASNPFTEVGSDLQRRAVTR